MALHLVSKEERRLPIRQQVQIVKQLHHWQFWHGWMTTSFEFFFGFLKGKLASKPWTCLFSRLSLDLSRFGGWTIARVVYFPTCTTRITRTYCGVTNVANHASFHQFRRDVSKWRTSKKTWTKCKDKKFTSNQSFQSCCPHFALFFWGGMEGMEGVVFSGVISKKGLWRSSFHQVSSQPAGSDRTPWPRNDPRYHGLPHRLKKTPRLLVEVRSLDSRLKIYLDCFFFSRLSIWK